MEFKGLKEGIYYRDLDIFVFLDYPKKDITGPWIGIKNNRIHGSEFGKNFPYYLYSGGFDKSFLCWLNSGEFWGLVSETDIQKNLQIGQVRNVEFDISIIFGDSYKDYLINTINHIIESHKSDTEEYQTELNISRFLIKEMKKLIAYKENIHGKSQLNTDIITSGLSSHPCKKAI